MLFSFTVDWTLYCFQDFEFELPHSSSSEVHLLAEESNVNIPGVWIYELTQDGSSPEIKAGPLDRYSFHDLCPGARIVPDTFPMWKMTGDDQFYIHPCSDRLKSWRVHNFIFKGTFKEVLISGVRFPGNVTYNKSHLITKRFLLEKMNELTFPTHSSFFIIPNPRKKWHEIVSFSIFWTQMVYYYEAKLCTLWAWRDFRNRPIK